MTSAHANALIIINIKLALARQRLSCIHFMNAAEPGVWSRWPALRRTPRAPPRHFSSPRCCAPSETCSPWLQGEVRRECWLWWCWIIVGAWWGLVWILASTQVSMRFHCVRTILVMAVMMMMVVVVVKRLSGDAPSCVRHIKTHGPGAERDKFE